MDTKHAFNTLDVHKISENDQDLGKEIYELSERTFVSISISWRIPIPGGKRLLSINLSYA